ncbi:MAG: metallophosphoesterase family protein, partial [Flavobacteriales bacterium]
MKLLLFSDVHENKKHCKNLVEYSKDADIVIGAGDFGNMRKGINSTVDILKPIEKPIILVPGNAESDDELKKACKGWYNAHVLHGNSVNISGENFYGIGGGIPITPFGSWSWDFSDEEAEQLLADLPQNGVLVSHSPPKDILDRSSSGGHFGST